MHSLLTVSDKRFEASGVCITLEAGVVVLPGLEGVDYSAPYLEN